MSETIRLRDGHGQFLRTDEILQKKTNYGPTVWIVFFKERKKRTKN